MLNQGHLPSMRFATRCALVSLAAIGALSLSVPSIVSAAEELPRCARPSSAPECRGGNVVVCAAEGMCLDRAGRPKRGCFDYICGEPPAAVPEQPAAGAGSATESPEEEARRLDEERNRAQGGGAGTESTETAPADLGVKTMPKGDLDIYTKPKDPTGGCGPGMHRGADGQCYPNVN
jgi:hypothetical protein